MFSYNRPDRKKTFEVTEAIETIGAIICEPGFTLMPYIFRRAKICVKLAVNYFAGMTIFAISHVSRSRTDKSAKLSVQKLIKWYCKRN